MASRVTIGSFAQADILEYFSYIVDKEKARAPAWRWYREVMSAIQGLRDFPERHPFIPEMDAVGREMRESFIHSHRIIYSVDTKAKSIFIHRLYHGSRRPLRSSDIGEIE